MRSDRISQGETRLLPSRERSGFYLIASVCTAIFAGCAVGPNYHRPPVNSPPAYRDDHGGTNAPMSDLSWWQVYQDENLQSLIREAFTNNYDLRIAVARVDESRAIAAQARSQFFPSVGYSGTVSQGRNDLFGGAFPNNGVTSGSAVSTLNAFWELDLWGRIRRLNESARAQLLASVEAQRGVRLTLLSEVASDYLRILELDEELSISEATTNSFGESLRIFTQRMNGGTASALEASRAQAALDDAAAQIPSIRQQIAITENELSVLLGRVPGAIAHAGASQLKLPPDVPAGLPSTLLERRPDVLQAEDQLHAANAEIGVAVADFFPQIDLTALLGKISPQLSAYSLGKANVWGIAAEGAGPIFEGGRLVGQYRQAKAERDEASLQYRQTILTALRDVSDALIARDRLAEIRVAQADEVVALEEAVRVSTNRYVAGKASYYEVLEAQQQLFPAQINLARTERDQQLAIVSLYEALGGGWSRKVDAKGKDDDSDEVAARKNGYR